jgi:cephalosporin-C deacetylase
MYFDLPLEQLKTYLPVRSEPEDFDAFWRKTLAQTRDYPLNSRFEPIETELSFLDVYDVTYNGYGGQPIKGWFLLPRDRAKPSACIVEFIGYGGGRGHPYDWLLWSNAGYAHFVMDVRGQGSTWRSGDTPDLEQEGGNPQIPGFITRGVLSPQTYFYRRVFCDAVRAVEAARSEAARVEESRLRWLALSRIWPRSCLMCLFCAISAMLQRSQIPIRMQKSRTTARSTGKRSR